MTNFLIKLYNPEEPDKLKLNMACGARTIEGFVNIDAARNVILSKYPWTKKFLAFIGVQRAKGLPDLPKDIVRMKLPTGLGEFRSNSANRIYSCHFIKHLTQKHAMQALQESYRILDRRGLFRIVAPDATVFVLNT